jgi:ArsR family transcriptional regulator
MTQICKDSSTGRSGAECCQDLVELLLPDFFKALSDPNRIALVARLAERGSHCTVSEIAACCPVDLSVVSRHLATLRQAGVVEAEKRGRQVYYSVRFSDLANALRRMADAIEACCPALSGETASANEQDPVPA